MKTAIGKTSISGDAERALERMVKIVNDGFNAGRVTKQDLASWVLVNFEKTALHQCLPAIRQHHFNQVAYMESLLAVMKAARKNGQPLDELPELLKPLTSRKSRQVIISSAKETE